MRKNTMEGTVRRPHQGLPQEPTMAAGRRATASCERQRARKAAQPVPDRGNRRHAGSYA
ncbi:MAG: hypothetical protein FWD08_06450 [Alphaproteobacteria bacterium]|nr:hypothetical protein [Alphaproteobacteria bacterium]